MATTRDLDAMRAELRGEISELRAEMHHGFRVQFYSLAGLMVGVLALVVAASSNGPFG